MGSGLLLILISGLLLRRLKQTPNRAVQHYGTVCALWGWWNLHPGCRRKSQALAGSEPVLRSVMGRTQCSRARSIEQPCSCKGLLRPSRHSARLQAGYRTRMGTLHISLMVSHDASRLSMSSLSILELQR